jgi:hypothetical protein
MLSQESIREMLAKGDRRTTGRADEVAEMVRRQPRKAAGLIVCLWDRDPGVVMRAADALEKACRDLPAMLAPYKAQILGLLAEATQKELRWHLAEILPRMQLTGPECARAAVTFESWLADSSSIVKTCALQGLADLTRQDASLEPMVLDLLRVHARTGTPAMRARGRILLKGMEHEV